MAGIALQFATLFCPIATQCVSSVTTHCDSSLVPTETDDQWILLSTAKYVALSERYMLRNVPRPSVGRRLWLFTCYPPSGHIYTYNLNKQPYVLKYGPK